MKHNKIETLRKEIDKIDEQIIDLFKKRIEFSSEILKIKKENNLQSTDEKRENLIFDSIKKKTGDFSQKIITEIYRTYLFWIKK